MIGVKMRHEEIFDLTQQNALSLKDFGELGKCAGPATIHEQLSTLDIDGIIVG
jgi:hypothetical protein